MQGHASRIGDLDEELYRIPGRGISFADQVQWIDPQAEACAIVNIGEGSDEPHIRIQKNLLDPPSGEAAPGDTVEFLIEVTNAGGMPLHTVRLIDDYPPACLSFQASPHPPDSVDPVMGVLVWDDLTNIFGPLMPGQTVGVPVLFKALAPCGMVQNCAETVGWVDDVSGHPDPMSFPHDTAYACEQVRILEWGAHLEISKIGQNGCVSDTLEYHLVVTNTGSEPLAGLRITDTYDLACLSFQPPASIPPLDPTDDGELEWLMMQLGGPPVLAPGEVMIITVPFHLKDECQPTHNVARASGWTAGGGSTGEVHSELPIFIDPLGPCEPAPLINGDFETGDFAGWSLNGIPTQQINTADVHSGAHAAELGGLWMGLDQSGNSHIMTSVAVPANAVFMELDYWYKLDVPPGNPPGFSGDHFYVLGLLKFWVYHILPPGPVSWDSNGWAHVNTTLDVTAMQGSSMPLLFVLDQNGQQGPARLLLDDISVCFQACGPARPPDHPGGPDFCWKCGDYADYAPSCVPDFDEHQDDWRNPDTDLWTHDGPTALANCFWWFDSKYEPGNTPPPAISDGYPLVMSYAPEVWDDHAPENVPPLIDELAIYVGTDGYGTRPIEMAEGAWDCLVDRDLADDYCVTRRKKPHYSWVRDEIVRCENVLLLLGNWEFQNGGWRRLGGHWVTASGVAREGFEIAVNDPLFDSAEHGYPGWYEPFAPHGHPLTPPDDVHNDAAYVSHDIYSMFPVNTPGGWWALRDYVRTDPVTGELLPTDRVFELNVPPEFADHQAEEYKGGDIITSVEYAVAISPRGEETVLRLAPRLGDVREGALIPIDLIIETGTGPATSAVAHLDFDPAHLQVVGSLDQPTSAIVPHFDAWSVLANEVDNGAGRIDFVAEGDPAEGCIRLGTILFQGIAANPEGVPVPFSTEGERVSDVRFGETSILDELGNGRVRVREAGEVVVQVDLQRRPEPPDDSWRVPLICTAHQPGADVYNRFYAGWTDEHGRMSIGGLTADLQDIHLKGLNTLRNVLWDVTPEGQTVDMGELIAGDCNNDNAVNGLDLSLLVGTLGLAEGDPGYDPRADLNGDGVVDMVDLNLLLGNLGLHGDQYLGPAGSSGAGTAPLSVSLSGINLEGDVILAIEPVEVEAEQGGVYDFEIMVHAGQQPVDTVELHIDYNPQELTIVDGAGDPATELVSGPALSIVGVNEVDGERGDILYLATESGSAPSGDFVVASFRVRAEAQVMDSWLLFTSDEGSPTDTYSGGESVLGELQASHLTIEGQLALPLIVKNATPGSAS